jgi:hypothetical protein
LFGGFLYALPVSGGGSPADDLTQIAVSLYVADDQLEALGAKTETEAVILSLESVLRQKKLKEFAALPDKLRLSITGKDLERMRHE